VRDEELTAAIREVRDRARARTPNGALGLEGVAAPDLMPLVHARDAAEAKVAAIGTVNPRPPGLKNSIAQALKRFVARALDWHVREQVEFNRGVMGCVQASLDALTEVSRGMAALSGHHRQFREEMDARERQLREELAAYSREAVELKDIRRHWAEWRVGFEDRRTAGEIHVLRTISELQASYQHRLTLLEQNWRELLAQQHNNFTMALDLKTDAVQKRLWQDLEKIRAQYEQLIYTELRTLRQKQPGVEASGRATVSAPAVPIPIDWMRFGDIFRGSEERIREHQRRYVAGFAGAEGEILDIGCGRGEFLDVARESGLASRGIDLSEECVALCRSKGLTAECADMFNFLEDLPDRGLGGVFCSQVVEHLPPERLPVLVKLLAAKLHPGALVAIETPNPECLAIFATHFYIDPTHTRPVPAVLMRFYLEEAGFGSIEVERLAPAIETMPALADLPSSVRDTFFGGLDYAIFARKL
jgi:2-polyprenyl-3-methyl-5-hydroxy-6-metoxy-1,4-benzoquinol methylase